MAAKNKQTFVCSISKNSYTGIVVNHISETPKSSKYWATIYGEWIEGKVSRPAYNIYIVLSTNTYYIIKDKTTYNNTLDI